MAQESDYILYEMDGGGTGSEIPVVDSSGGGRPGWLIPAIAAGLVVALVIAYFVIGGRRQEPVVTTPPARPPEGMILIPAGPFPFGPQKAQVDLPNFFHGPYRSDGVGVHEILPGHRAAHAAGRAARPGFQYNGRRRRAYARWTNKRLPTPQEWEKAVRGTAGNLYPWGDQHEPRERGGGG